MLNVLYEDDEIIVVWKPVGMESQSSRGFGADMVSEIRRHIHISSTRQSTKAPANVEKPRIPYVGVIHRLDKPVSGILVYAKTKNAAAALSRQVATGQMTKKYQAVVCGKVDKNVDNFVDYLLKDEKGNSSQIVDKGMAGAKRAELDYRVLARAQSDDWGELALLEITLKTGRHHQIRVQMAGHGIPLWGDNKYNPVFFNKTGSRAAARKDVALAACQLSFSHPATGERMTFTAAPEGKVFNCFHG